AAAPAPRAPAAGRTPPGEPALGRAALRALAFGSGAATLALEVLWTRMFAQVLQNSAYTFALVLTVFLVALGLGAGLARALMRSGADPARTLAALLLAAGLATPPAPPPLVRGGRRGRHPRRGRRRVGPCRGGGAEAGRA